MGVGSLLLHVVRARVCLCVCVCVRNCLKLTGSLSTKICASNSERLKGRGLDDPEVAPILQRVISLYQKMGKPLPPHWPSWWRWAALDDVDIFYRCFLFLSFFFLMIYFWITLCWTLINSVNLAGRRHGNSNKIYAQIHKHSKRRNFGHPILARRERGALLFICNRW